MAFHKLSCLPGNSLSCKVPLLYNILGNRYLFKIKHQGHIELLDRFGKPFASYSDVLNKEGLLTKEMDASAIPKGIYYYVVRINNKTVTKRMVIN
jgi:hypothetical protein